MLSTQPTKDSTDRKEEGVSKSEKRKNLNNYSLYTHLKNYFH
jgi:hypothetical protein